MIKVTGAGGFIGQAIINYCVQQEIPVVGYSRSVSSEFIERIDSYENIPAGGRLIHLAEEKVASQVSELIGQKQVKLSRFLSQIKFDNIVYVSSASVYSSSPDLIEVDSPNYSTSLYSKFKRQSENFFLENGFSVARLSNVYGSNMYGENLFSTIISQATCREIKIFTLNSVRDYIWVEDAARQLVELAISSLSGKFHISTGNATSVEEVIRVSCDLHGNTDYKIVEIKPVCEFSKIVLSNKKTLRLLNLEEPTRIEVGLEKIIKGLNP